MEKVQYQSLGSIIQSSIFFVPDYQREYSWTVAEVEDFWYDLENLVYENRPSHFFGQIVIHCETNETTQTSKRFIIDGQQRFSTSLIFASVVRNIYKELLSLYPDDASLKTAVKLIEVKYLGIIEDYHDDIKLHLGKVDKEYFRDRIIVEKPIKEKLLPSHGRIKAAYDYIYGKLISKFEEGSNLTSRVKILDTFFKGFMERFHATYVETHNLNEAFVIFETLNARGMDLETSDLLKNHLFRTAGNRIDEVKEYWDKMSSHLGKVDKTKYVRHFWNSSNVFTRDRDLYKRIRDSISSPKSSEQFMKSLFEYSKLYSFLSNPGEDSYYESADSNDSIRHLSTLNAKSFFPLILAIEMEKFSENSKKMIISSVENLVFRNLTVCGKNPNELELFFAKLAKDISDRIITESNEVIKAINQYIVSDEIFTSLFSTMTIRNKDIVRYIFQRMNNYLSKETQVIMNNTVVHIEHIMPETLGEWKIDPIEHADNLWRLGNLTLLFGPDNQSIQNYSFETKKGIYKDSELFLTKDIAEFDIWDISTINLRQTFLSYLANIVWIKEV